MTHIDEGTIHAWLDGELKADEAQRVETHVRDCAQCAAAVAEARGLVAASSRILGALDDVPGNVIPASAPVQTPSRVWRAAPWVTGIAAVLVAAVVLRTSDLARESAPSARMTQSVAAIAESVSPAIDTVKPAADPPAGLAVRAAPVAAPPAPRARVEPQRARAGVVAAAAEKSAVPAAESFVVSSEPAEDVRKREAAVGLAGCYTLGVAIVQPAPERQYLGDMAVTDRQRRRAASEAMPSVAAANLGAAVHRLVRLETATRDSGFVARDVRADSIIGTWNTVAADSAEVLLGNGLRVRVPRAAMTNCP